MSTDQQWAGGGRMGMQHEQIHERRVPLHKRVLPFLGLVLVGVLGLPLLELGCWGIGLIDPPTGRLIRWAWIFTGVLLAMVAMGIGFKVTRRIWFVVWHVVVTVLVVCLGAALTTEIGPTSRVWDVVHIFSLGILAVSWNLYRIDALRAVAQGQTGGDQWGALIGLARSRPRKITTNDAHVVVEIEHGPGETIKEVEGAKRKIESATGALRATVTPGERSDSSTLTLTMADPFADWRTFPGLSHPGESFAYPIRTAYYETGVDQWFSFVRSLSSPHTSFVSPGATFLGLAGTTGSGKSGSLSNTAAETLSRSDAVVVWADAEKFFQNAGWCVDMLAMAAKDKAQARRMTTALRKLAEYRVELFGQAQLDAIMDPEAPMIGREWTTELAEQLREPAVLVIADEADTIIQTKAWEWLGARGRSLGIFILAAIPRASTNEVSALMRGSIATWKTFSIGDRYSDDFTMSQDTRDAGADPKKLREPGLHYLDMAPGVKPQMYPVLAREFKSEGRYLRRLVQDAREHFEPMPLSPGSIARMGDDYLVCTPAVAMSVKTPEQAIAEMEAEAREATPPATEADMQDTRELTAKERQQLDETAADQRRANTTDSDRDPDGEYDDEGEEEPMQVTASGTRPGDTEVSVTDQGRLFDAATQRELAALDPHKPISMTTSGDRIEVPSEKSRWTGPQFEAELDRVLILLVERRQLTFSNADVMDLMECDCSAATMSRRLDALAEGKRPKPDRIDHIVRHGAGRFEIILTKPRPRV